MEQQEPPGHDSGGDDAPREDAGTPGDDPWVAFSYLVSGIAFYGLIGWGLSRWLHADYLIPLGIVVGAGFGLYLVFSRFARIPNDANASSATKLRHTRPPDRSEDASAFPDVPDIDDRGDTA